MKLFLSLLFSFFAGIAHSQLGIQVASTYNSIQEWQVAYENGLTGKHSPIMRYGTLITFRYRVGSPSGNLYLAPSVAIDRNTQDFSYHHFELVGYNLIGALGYRFFSIGQKRNPSLPALSVNAELALGAGLSTMLYKRPVYSDGEYTGEQEHYQNKQVSATFGLNLSSEIFVSEKFSFGPMLGIRWVPELSWTELPTLIDSDLPPELGESQLMQWTIGVLFQWRFAKRTE